MSQSSMYLSRLLLNPEHVQARKDLASPYQLHKTLANAFPDPESEQHRARHGVLFRIEEPGARGAPVMIQSISEPDWSLLPPGYALRIDGPKPFDPAFAPGQALRFRLVANPVRRVRIDGKAHPRRFALTHPHATDRADDGYLDWLLRQAEAHGFALPTNGSADHPLPEVEHLPFRLDRKRRMESDPEKIETIAKKKLPHFGVRFDGVLRVTDPTRLLKAVRQGIGPAKAFGFGLLSLARHD